MLLPRKQVRRRYRNQIETFQHFLLNSHDVSETYYSFCYQFTKRPFKKIAQLFLKGSQRYYTTSGDRGQVNCTQVAIIHHQVNLLSVRFLSNEKKQLIKIFLQLNLACQLWKQNMIGTVHGIGMILAMLVSGWTSDRY